MNNSAPVADVFGFCDRCGFRYPLSDLRQESVNLTLMKVRVCPVCMDIDSKQFRAGALLGSDDQSIHGRIAPDPSVLESREFIDETDSFVSFSTNTITDYLSSSVDKAQFRTSIFSIFGPVMQYKALVRTTNEEFNGVCSIRYQADRSWDLEVSSAKLRVGSPIVFQTYTNPPIVDNHAYRVIKGYDPDSVTWNSFGSGGVAGVDYTTSGSVIGVIGSYYTEWDLTGIVRGWLNGDFENYGLFFPDMGTSFLGNATPRANVVWTITSRRVLN